MWNPRGACSACAGEACLRELSCRLHCRQKSSFSLDYAMSLHGAWVRSSAFLGLSAAGNEAGGLAWGFKPFICLFLISSLSLFLLSFLFLHPHTYLFGLKFLGSRLISPSTRVQQFWLFSPFSPSSARGHSQRRNSAEVRGQCIGGLLFLFYPVERICCLCSLLPPPAERVTMKWRGQMCPGGGHGGSAIGMEAIGFGG